MAREIGKAWDANRTCVLQEMMNFWKQTAHVMAYFKEENFRGEKRLPSNFMTGFLEVSLFTAETATVKIQELMIFFL